MGFTHESYDLMDKRGLAEIIWEGMNQDRILGPCPECHDAIGHASTDLAFLQILFLALNRSSVQVDGR
jgi:hypothetical protein